MKRHFVHLHATGLPDFQPPEFRFLDLVFTLCLLLIFWHLMGN